MRRQRRGLVLRGHVHGPEVEAGTVVEVDGDAADGRVALAGNEVAVGAGLAGARSSARARPGSRRWPRSKAW